MDYNSGEFVCPKCGENGMDIYTNRIIKKKYFNNCIEKRWIFYNKIFLRKKM